MSAASRSTVPKSRSTPMSCRTPLRKLLTGSGSFRPGDSPCGRAAIASVGVGLVRWGVGDQTNANAMAARSAGGLLAERRDEATTVRVAVPPTQNRRSRCGPAHRRERTIPIVGLDPFVCCDGLVFKR